MGIDAKRIVNFEKCNVALMTCPLCIIDWYKFI